MPERGRRGHQLLIQQHGWSEHQPVPPSGDPRRSANPDHGRTQLTSLPHFRVCSTFWPSSGRPVEGEDLRPLLPAPVQVRRVDQDGARHHGRERDGEQERGRDQDPCPHAGVEAPKDGSEEAQRSSCRGALSITAGRHSLRDSGRLLGGNGPPLRDFATQCSTCKGWEACDIAPHVRLNIRFRTPKSFGFAAPA